MSKPTDDAAEAAAQRWTHVVPTKPGAYLYAFGHTGVQLLWLIHSKRDGRWLASQGGIALDADSYFEEVIWWLGPLSIPEIPE